jgi:hypothetical protein
VDLTPVQLRRHGPASIFGSKLEGNEWKTSGKKKLEDVIGILYQLVCWVNSLKGKKEVPIQDVQEHFNVVART